MKGHVMKDSSLMTCMCWSDVHALLSSICCDSIERNILETFLVVFWWLLAASMDSGRVMSADTDSCGVLLRQTHMVRQDLWEDT